MKINNYYNMLDDALQKLSLINWLIGMSIFLLIIEVALAYLIPKDYSFKLAKVFGEDFNNKVNYYFKKLVELNRINSKLCIVVILLLLVFQVIILIVYTSFLVDHLEGYVKLWLKARMITKLYNTSKCSHNLTDTNNYGLLDEGLGILGWIGWLIGFNLFPLIIEVALAYLIPKDYSFKLAKVFGEDFNDKVNYYFKKLAAMHRDGSKFWIVVQLSILVLLWLLLIYDVSLLVDIILSYT